MLATLLVNTQRLPALPRFCYVFDCRRGLMRVGIKDLNSGQSPTLQLMSWL